MRLVCPACPGRSNGCAMINPKLLDKILAISFGILTLIVALLAYLNAEKIWEELTRSIFEPTITLPRIVIIIFIFISIFFVSYLWNYFLFKIRAGLNNTRHFLAAAEGQRKQLDLLRFVDVITRIPNQLQWEEDIESIQSELAGGHQFQSILIDLDGFKLINDKFGFDSGDAVILCFAQSLYESMRRNEKIYKTPLNNIDPRKLWTRIYRKYAGGDEFIFLIRGPEEEALGFLIRIHRMTIGPIKSEISGNLGTTVDFDFHGAICPIFPKDDASTAIARLRDGYNMVKKRRVSRVYWYTDRRSKDIDEAKDRRLRKVYEDAELEFALPSGRRT